MSGRHASESAPVRWRRRNVNLGRRWDSPPCDRSLAAPAVSRPGLADAALGRGRRLPGSALSSYHRGPTPPRPTPEEERKENGDQDPKELTVRQNGVGSVPSYVLQDSRATSFPPLPWRLRPPALRRAVRLADPRSQRQAPPGRSPAPQPCGYRPGRRRRSRIRPDRVSAVTAIPDAAVHRPPVRCCRSGV